MSWPCAISCHCDALTCYFLFDTRSSRLEHNIRSILARQTVKPLCMVLHILYINLSRLFFFCPLQGVLYAFG